MDKKNMEEDIPTFTAPKGNDDVIPTFSAPKVAGIDGQYCKDHPDIPAAGKCDKCGKYICKDCLETCAITLDGKSYNLCFDCCKKIFESDKEKFKKDKSKILFHYILTLVGVIIGFSLGIGDGFIMALILAVIGGSFLAAIKPIGSTLLDVFKGMFELASGNIGEAIVHFLVGVVNFLWVSIQCAFRTGKKLIKYTIYLIQTNKSIKETNEYLKNIQDFMDYMAYMSSHKGENVNDLVAEGGALANNFYAKIYAEKGEAAADEAIRKATTIIAENGEIIRTFDVNAA